MQTKLYKYRFVHSKFFWMNNQHITTRTVNNLWHESSQVCHINPHLVRQTMNSLSYEQINILSHAPSTYFPHVLSSSFSHEALMFSHEQLHPYHMNQYNLSSTFCHINIHYFVKGINNIYHINQQILLHKSSTFVMWITNSLSEKSTKHIAWIMYILSHYQH